MLLPGRGLPPGGAGRRAGGPSRGPEPLADADRVGTRSTVPGRAGRARGRITRANGPGRELTVAHTQVRGFDAVVPDLPAGASVYRGQTVTLSYPDPMAGDDPRAIQDRAGNDLASFTGLSITNNSPVSPPDEGGGDRPSAPCDLTATAGRP